MSVERISGSKAIESRLETELRALEEKGRKRILQLPTGIDFTSNDYLGLTQNASIKEQVLRRLASDDIALGSGGSRLLRGNHRSHELVETDFAEFVGAEAGLFFTSGYMANMAVLTAIPNRHDLIVFDSLVHASLREGIHASFAAKKSFEHNSLESLRSLVSSSIVPGQIYVVVESLYSMDGDEAPLKELTALCKEYGLALIVDEAHATGLFGNDGSGLIDEAGIRNDLFLSVHPCGKAMATAGAFVCSSQIVKEYLLNKARTMIFTTALPPIIAEQLRLVITEIVQRPSLREQAIANAAVVRTTLEHRLERWKVLPGRSPIIPLIIGSDNEAVAVAKALQGLGIDVRPIRPPTVAEGTSRFRLTVSALHTPEQLQLLTDSLIEFEPQFVESQ